jgi:hypothetical protein
LYFIATYYNATITWAAAAINLEMFRIMYDLEPFAEKLWSAENALGSPQYRVGYRLSTTQTILAYVEMPAETVERAVLSNLMLFPRITPDGLVTADVSIKNDLASEAHIEVTAMPIDQLVIRGTDSEHLRAEEAQVSELHMLICGPGGSSYCHQGDLNSRVAVAR